MKIGDKNITEFNSNQLAELRTNDIGLIFQDFNLIPFLNVKENILFSLRLKGEKIENHSDNYEQLVNWLGIKKIEEKYINEISGGEQQRTAIARCLLMEPKIILADEPTGNLDKKNTDAFLKLIRTLPFMENKVFIIVTHDESVERFCDQVFKLEEGQIIT
nr:ATP-binding cassette domain-containing protein [Enterococcus faecalis]